MNNKLNSSKCLHNKLIRKKDLLWQCIICKSFFMVQIQNDDKHYIWLNKPQETEVERFIDSWWHETKNDDSPKTIIKHHIKERLAHLDFNLETIVDIERKQLETYMKNIQNTIQDVKKWFYILHCFENGDKEQKKGLHNLDKGVDK